MMMRYIWILLLHLPALLKSQKEDNIWVFGYDSNLPNTLPGVERTILNFKDTLVISSTSINAMPLAGTNAMICDSSGQLLLVTNGCHIENALGQNIPGGDTLNPQGIMSEWHCFSTPEYGLPGQQRMMILPLNGQYYIFMITVYFQIEPTVIAYSDKLNYTLLQPLGNQQWEVLEKNQTLYQDTLSTDGLHAVRHANGRDWWIVTARERSNHYFISLLTPDGINTQTQDIGEPTFSQSGGEIVFSPDGSKMARFNGPDDLRIFDFDRCSGTLSNPVFIPITSGGDNEIYSGLAFSADGHYLYAAEIERIWQFDMWATDIAASMINVAENDWVNCPFQPALAYMELGPDGKIYCKNLNGSYCMHRINNPEKGGLACDVQQRALQFVSPFTNIPHFPNFRLGPIDGSAGDTLGINNVPLAGFRYDPLPASPNGGGVVEFTSVSWYEPTHWLWDFGDGQQSSERNPVHTFNTSGAHDVCLTVSNQYGLDVKCKTVWVGTTSASDDLFMQDDLWRIYPNPTNGEVSVTSTTGNTWEGTIMVTDGLGHQVLKTTAAQFSLASLPNGMYFVQGVDVQGRGIFTKRVAVFK